MKNCDARRSARHPFFTFRRALAPVLFALIAPVLASPAHAQTCTQLPQRMSTTGNLSTTTTQLNGWTASSPTGTSGAWQSYSLTTPSATNHGGQLWSDGTANGNQFALTTTAANSPTKVSGGAVLTFSVAWNNAQYGNFPAGANSDAHLVYDGNQYRLQVLYAGVVYTTVLTAPVDGRSNNATSANNYNDWGPTNSSLVANNGAQFVNAPPASPPPSYVGGRGSAQFTTPVVVWTKVSIRLPDNIPQTGAIQFLATRMQSTFSDTNRSDDFYVKDVILNDRTLCLAKATSASSNGGAFTFTTTNLDTDQVAASNQNSAIITTSSANPTVAFDGDTSTAGTQPALVMANQVTLTEAPATGFGLSSVSCDNGVSGSISGNQITLSSFNASSETGLMVTCTVTNTRPRIRLQKTLPGGRALAGDQFTLNIAGPRGGTATTASVTTTGSGSTATGVADFNPADASGSYTLSETASGTTVLTGYATSYACTNATSGSSTVMPSGTGTSFNLVPAAADDITCTFSNTARLSNLAISKTNTPASGPNDQPADTVTRGATVTYSIVVSNGGPQSSDGAVLRDPTPTGVSCTTVACSVTSGGATCPAPASLTVANLQSSGGVAIPSMPANSSLTFSLTCAAN
ncbi:prealbumin-like fold domain-containing protein [Luteimonas panaciterrae]|uniref:prealbumin-like fold domain-containing protein n=1 Tax=Luteimonas panaciterrae TaxID=363885 RepID=UPI001CFB3A60|nr:DUF11 domain-containing protein [Luteimonas panaciterrae]